MSRQSVLLFDVKQIINCYNVNIVRCFVWMLAILKSKSNIFWSNCLVLKSVFVKLYSPTAIRYIPVTSGYLSYGTSLFEEKRRERLPVSHRFEQSEIIVIFSFLKVRPATCQLSPVLYLHRKSYSNNSNEDNVFFTLFNSYRT